MTMTVGLWWALAPAGVALDPARYLGELDQLPEPRLGGEWCDVRIHDDEGELSWRLVAVEAGREDSLFEARREEPIKLERGLTEPLEKRGG